MSVSNSIADSTGNFSNVTLEARLEARLEGALEDFGQGESRPHCTIKAACANTTSAYNSVEDRVHILETCSPSYIRRIAKLEDFVRPFEQYDKKTQEAVSELRDLKKKFQAPKAGGSKDLEKKLQIIADGTTKRLDGLSKRIDEVHPADLTKVEERLQGLAADITNKTKALSRELTESTAKTEDIVKRLDDLSASDGHQAVINSSVQTLLTRVLKLENDAQSSATAAKPLSTNNLALALINRFSQGDSIDNATLTRLREVMPSAIALSVDQNAISQPAIAPMQTSGLAASTSADIAAREESRSSQRRKRSFERSNAEDDGNDTAPMPRKRRRPTKKSTSDLRKSLLSAPTKQTDEATTKGIVGQDGQDEEDGATATKYAAGGEGAEIRRSTRTPKPNKKHASFLTWIEVRDRRKTR